MIELLLTAFAVAAYLLVGTFYARANARHCYELAAKRWANRTIGRMDLVNQSYRERLALHVLAWPVVWPTRLIAQVASAPVGDLETAYQMWQLMQEQINLGRKELEQ